MLPIIRDGLVLEMHFNELSGSTAYDLSGYNNNGTIYGATRVQEGFGRALSFDGVDDYVEIPDAPSLQIINQLTIIAWINETGRKPIAKIVSRRSGSYFYFLGIDNGKPYGGVGDGLSHSITIKSFTMPLNEWHYLAFVYDDNNNKMYLYYDGILKETVNTTISLPAKIGVKLSIGADFEGTQSFFNGLIDEVLIYNRALSESEIRAIYNYYMKKRM